MSQGRLLDNGLGGVLLLRPSGSFQPANIETLQRFAAIESRHLDESRRSSDIADFADEFGSLLGGDPIPAPRGLRTMRCMGSLTDEVVVEPVGEWVFHSRAARDIVLLDALAKSAKMTRSVIGAEAVMDRLTVFDGMCLYCGTAADPAWRVPLSDPGRIATPEVRAWARAMGSAFAAVRPYAGEDTLGGRMGWLTRKTARELAASYLDTYEQAFPGKPGSLLESIQGQLRSLVESKDMLSFCTYCGRPISPSSSTQAHDSYACKYALYRRKGDMVAALESYGVDGEKAADDLLYRRAPTR